MTEDGIIRRRMHEPTLEFFAGQTKRIVSKASELVDSMSWQVKQYI